MQSLSKLEQSAGTQPNSIEVQQALAEAYARDERWEEAVSVYRKLTLLYPDTAALFINRIQLGASALMISSCLILIAVLIQPSLKGDGLAEMLSSNSYVMAQALHILALAFYSTSAISIYKLLSYTRDHRPAFWGMVLSVIGVGLSMPALGINAFVHPLIGKMLLAGQSDALTIYRSLTVSPLSIYLNMGNYVLIAGILIFAWVINRNRGLSLPAVLIFLSGWIGMIFSNFTGFSVLVVMGGFWLGLSLWQQASVQFDPNMDRTQRA